MSKITQLNEKAIAVQVPEYAAHIHIQDLRDWEFCLSYKHNGEWFHADLPHPGMNPWSILGRGNELTEDQWKGVAQLHEVAGESGYGDYQYPDSRFPITAPESGLSLLKSKGLNPENTLILQKIC